MAGLTLCEQMASGPRRQLDSLYPWAVPCLVVPTWRVVPLGLISSAAHPSQFSFLSHTSGCDARDTWCHSPGVSQWKGNSGVTEPTFFTLAMRKLRTREVTKLLKVAQLISARF